MATWLRRGQRGDGKIGLIIAILLLCTIGYLIMKWVPVRTQNAEFSEFVERAAQRFAINDINEAQLMDSINEYCVKEHIPLNEGDARVDVLGDKIVVKVKYHIDIALVGGKVWTQNYEVATETRRF